MTTEQIADAISVMKTLKAQLKGLWLVMANAATTYEEYDQVIRDLHWQMHTSNASKEPGRVEKAFTTDVVKAVSNYVNQFPK